MVFGAGTVYEAFYRDSLWPDYGGYKRIWHGGSSGFDLCSDRESDIPCVLSTCYLLRLSLSGMWSQQGRHMLYYRPLASGVGVESGRFSDCFGGRIFFPEPLSAGEESQGD